MKSTLIILALLSMAGCSSGEADAPDNKTTIVDGADRNVSSSDDIASEKGHLFSMLSHDQEEDLALAINLSGNLCGKFVGAVPVGGMILAECQEYHKKEGHYVRYWIRGLEQQSVRVEKAFVLKPSGWPKVR